MLALQALSHTVRDASVYFAAALVGGIVGTLDEGIQWATPDRVWDLGDIWLDFVGAAGVQVAVAAGIRPDAIAPRFTAAGVQTLCRVALVGVVLLGASLLNSPGRIEWYATRVPGWASC